MHLNVHCRIQSIISLSLISDLIDNMDQFLGSNAVHNDPGFVPDFVVSLLVPDFEGPLFSKFPPQLGVTVSLSWLRAATRWLIKSGPSFLSPLLVVDNHLLPTVWSRVSLLVTRGVSHPL